MREATAVAGEGSPPPPAKKEAGREGGKEEGEVEAGGKPAMGWTYGWD
jgi:hypothetical protein